MLRSTVTALLEHIHIHKHRYILIYRYISSSGIFFARRVADPRQKQKRTAWKYFREQKVLGRHGWMACAVRTYIRGLLASCRQPAAVHVQHLNRNSFPTFLTQVKELPSQLICFASLAYYNPNRLWIALFTTLTYIA